MLRLGSRDSGNRPKAFMMVDDGWKTATQRIGQLVGANRDESFLTNVTDQLERALQLLFALKLECSLVRLHAAACTARENEAVEGRRG